MIAQGEHLILRMPPKKDNHGKVLLPDVMERQYAYGRVVSIGPKASAELGVPDKSDQVREGDLVMFDHLGARSLELEVRSDVKPTVVCVHAAMIFCKIDAKQLTSRDLPIP